MMTQDDINQAEWENPANWSDNIVGVYFSKRDNRVWVPKRRPGVGWTLNMGHRWGAWWLAGLLVIPPVLAGFLGLRTRDVRREASKNSPHNPTGAAAG